MRKYEEYKDSGIDWLESIPSHWTINQIKRSLKLLTDYDANGSFSDIGKNVTRVSDDTKYAWFVRTTDLEKFYNNINLDNFIWIDEKSYNYLKKSKLYSGDLLLAKRGDIGKIYLMPKVDVPTSLAPNLYLARLNNKHITSHYAYYFLITDFGQKQLNLRNKSTTLGALYKDDFKSLEFPFPPLKEQQTIANYLDAKTQAIDKKVTLLEQKIETYKKLKNTIIAKAVTQGISNQELSINDLGFKTSANWTKYRLKDLGKLFSGLSGKSGDDFNQEDNPNNRGFIPFTNIANNTYLKKDHLGTVVINPGEKQNKVRKGDLFFLMSSEGYGDIGKTAVLADDIDEAYLNSFCKGYRVNQNKCNPYFLNYLLLSNIYRQRLIVEGKGFTRINLKMEKVTDFEIFLPPTLSEQQEIANYIDHKTATIDAIVDNIGKQIETLKQLRKTLINDVVTGKIKVIE